MNETSQTARCTETGKAPSRFPAWIRVRMTGSGKFDKTREILRRHELNTVCEEAHCPNIGECYGHLTATFLILGKSCTRRCAFCAVDHDWSNIAPPDPDEPERVARAAAEMGLRHVVITSVTRDDLPDRGAGQFVRCAHAIRRLHPSATIEALIPDFQGEEEPLAAVLASPVDVLNHNIETVPRLYPIVRRNADYRSSISLLAAAERLRPDLPTKSGLMLGLGETASEVHDTLHDLRSVGCAFLILGQYLQPGPVQMPVTRYLEPKEFEQLRIEALEMGFRQVVSAPLARSSYHAADYHLTA
ncbi:MAG: lipoyl synthase [bacterium]|nr:lipoyl synthase [Candidatus Sumerlaeota bacterium]